jgi:hypothetical protein
MVHIATTLKGQVKYCGSIILVSELSNDNIKYIHINTAAICNEDHLNQRYH